MPLSYKSRVVSKAIDALMVLVLSSFTHFAGFISAGIIS